MASIGDDERSEASGGGAPDGSAGGAGDNVPRGIDTWQRERLTTGGGPARVVLIALAPRPLPDPLPVSRSRHGVPDDSSGVETVSVCPRHLGEHAEWFAGFRGSGLAAVIAEDLGGDALAAGLAAEHAYLIEAELDDALDLGHLQTAWALAKCACELGAVVVVDVFAGRAWAAAEVAALAPDRPFDIVREISLLAEDLAPDVMAIFTRGMVKLGRTDVVATPIAPADASGIAHLLRDMAAALAAGDLLEPGDGIELPDGSRFVIVAPEPALTERLGLDQPTVVMQPAGSEPTP
jgi:hypothetical protein